MRRRSARRERGRTRASHSSVRRASCSPRFSPPSTSGVRTCSSANVLKHRPPGNRNPTPDEVVACSPYLVRQIELIQPKVILALGTFAAQTLLEHEAHDRQAAWSGAPLLRRTADRDLPSRRAPAQSVLEASHLGRCPACPSNTRSRPPRWGVTPMANGVLPGRRTPSRPCSRPCSSTRTRSCARSRSSTTPCSTPSATGGSSARCSRSRSAGASSIRSRWPTSSQRRGELDGAGGKDYIGFLVDAVPTSANVEYHARIVARRRSSGG